MCDIELFKHGKNTRKWLYKFVLQTHLKLKDDVYDNLKLDNNYALNGVL